MHQPKQRYEELNEAAIALQNMNQHAQAEPLLVESLNLEPNNFVALYSLGVSKTLAGDNKLASELLSIATQVHPNIALGFAAYGKSLQDQGRYDEALNVYDQALSLDSSDSGVYHNKACILQIIGRHKDALYTLIQATEVNPLDATAYEGQGILLSQYKEYEKAAQVFLSLLQISPGTPYALGQLMNAKQHICDWDGFDAIREAIMTGVDQGLSISNPLSFMAISSSADLARKCAAIFGEHKFPMQPHSIIAGKKWAHHKKRIGFISGDFREHPVGYLFIGVIEQFDRANFELTGFFTGKKDGSTTYQRYASSFDNFISCGLKTDSEIAHLIHAFEIDVLIDLSGYTADSRIGVLSHRPAPIQMTYLGFPGTLGLSYIDYLIGDQNTVPPQFAAGYSEKVLYLSQCYLPRDDSIQMPTPMGTRAKYGLPEEGFVFCSFNHNYKITPQIFQVWVDLLQSVEGSCLWLMDLNATAKKNLLAYAEKQVDPSRIVFAQRVPSIDEHLARYCLADLFLDTFPYNGHTTCSDALYSGLPLITLQGESFASRVCSSLLADLDLQALSAQSYEDYYQLAFELAQNSEKLSDIKEKLSEQLAANQWTAKSQAYARDMAQLIAKVA